MGDLVAYDLLYKFIIIGDSGTGKSCLLRYFLERKFGKRKLKLQIWDTAGQERFRSCSCSALLVDSLCVNRSVTRSYFRGAIGCLLVYDIGSYQSYKNLSNWLTDARSLARQDIMVVLVGNKSDQKAGREVSQADASKFAIDNDLLFLETSALTGDCVDEAFTKCASAICKKIDEGKIDLPSIMAGVYPHAKALEPEQASGCRC